ncbi:MAG: GMC family oxidoreductase, partial [Flavobacteriaceae bacterium]|nr:GMC family oxidoreductase [Flavobacteriaceae bacterium]
VGVGGGSLVYANTLPIPKSEFFNSGNWKGLADWENELKPFYTVAEKMLGATKNPKFYDADITLQKVAQQMGRSNEFEAPKVSVFFGKSNVAVKDPFFNGEGPDRVGCNFCGQCMTGCPHNAKNSLDKNYLYLAQKKGAKVIAEKLVTSVKLLDDTNSKFGYIVDFKDSTSYFNKGIGSVITKGVIFSGGVLGTIRLLLNMKAKKNLPNLSEEVGNYIRTNNENLSLITTRDKNIDLSKGIAIGSIFSPDKDGHIEAVRYGAGSNFWKILIIPMVFGKNVGIRIFQLLKELVFHPTVWIGNYFRKDYAKRTIILLFMQHLDSTIKLKRGWFNLSSKLSSGLKPTPFIPMAK